MTTLSYTTPWDTTQTEISPESGDLYAAHIGGSLDGFLATLHDLIWVSVDVRERVRRGRVPAGGVASQSHRVPALVGLVRRPRLAG
jgi:hypothetical protein